MTLAEREAIEKALGRRELSCQCCSAVDDVGLDELIVEVLRLRQTRAFPSGHALMDGSTCECGLRLGGDEGTARDWHAQHLAERVLPPAGGPDA